MANPVNVPNSTLMAELNELIAGTNLFVGAVMHLFKAPVAVSPDMAVASFSECDFTGYAPSSTVVWTPAFVSPNGVPTITGGLKAFALGATPTVFNTVYGWFLTDSAGSTLLFWRAFDTPIVLAVPYQGFDVIPSMPAYIGS